MIPIAYLLKALINDELVIEDDGSITVTVGYVETTDTTELPPVQE